MKILGEKRWRMNTAEKTLLPSHGNCSDGFSTPALFTRRTGRVAQGKDTQGIAQMLQVEKPGPSLRQPASSVKGQAVHIFGSGSYAFDSVQSQECKGSC